jgi:epoxyqueuosine reductase
VKRHASGDAAGEPGRAAASSSAAAAGLKHDAAVALGNVGTADDADVLTHALDDEEPLVREHAAWALARVRHRGR